MATCFNCAKVEENVKKVFNDAKEFAVENKVSVQIWQKRNFETGEINFGFEPIGTECPGRVIEILSKYRDTTIQELQSLFD